MKQKNLEAWYLQNSTYLPRNTVCLRADAGIQVH